MNIGLKVIRCKNILVLKQKFTFNSSHSTELKDINECKETNVSSLLFSRQTTNHMNSYMM
jgi:hypothetical protein